MRCERGIWRRIALAALTAAVGVGNATAPAFAAPKAATHPSNACTDPDEKPRFPWQAFNVGNTCVEFTNSLSFVYQNLMQSSGSLAAPARAGTASAGTPVVKTLTFSPTIDTTTHTRFGDLKTSFGLSIERTSDDDAVRTTLSNATVALAGLTVGYDESVMNFWEGDFQFSAAVPQRTVGILRYDHPVSENSKLGISLETGVPTSSPPPDEFAPLYTDDPVLAARWRYETDPLTVLLAGMMHELKFDGGNRRLPRPAGAPDKVFGWAVTAGATVALPFLGDDDNVSVQATYAVNASPYLGTSSDLSTLASIVPFNVETQGWSAVASYHRAWSERWEANLFVSYLDLDISTPAANPAVQTTRLAGNLIFTPVKGIRFGGELGFIDARLELNGPFGLLNGASGRQLTGYLFADVEF